MKMIGKIIALLLAAIVSVLAVQQTIKRMYAGWGRRYIDLTSDNGGEDE